MAERDPRRFLGYLQAERNAALLYRALAQTVDGERREAFLELADIEVRDYVAAPTIKAPIAV